MSQHLPSQTDLSFGYCTNVHAGATLALAKENLDRIATDVRRRLVPNSRLPVGLWLSHKAAEQLHMAGETPLFGEWLAGQGLKAYTFNGFPQGDFHQPVVKYEVYKPTWLDESRLQYTMQLADILVQLLDGDHGSISTLPLGWPHVPWTSADLQKCGQQLQRLAEYLNQVWQRTGKEIVLAIEPEPGCVLDTAIDIVSFLEAHVLDDARPFIRRHIGVCHDICHSAVMFEPQRFALEHYLKNGIRIGKVQVSSAVEVPWRGTGQFDSDSLPNRQTWQQLQAFDEPRYLHQTTRELPDSSQPQMQTDNHHPRKIEMVDDLPYAFAQWIGSSLENRWPEQPWRIHFHVPIFIKQFGQLLATRDAISEAIHFLESHRRETVDGAPWFTGDYEVETYAWGVLPPELRGDNLADGIARELSYLQSLLKGDPS